MARLYLIVGYMYIMFLFNFFIYFFFVLYILLFHVNVVSSGSELWFCLTYWWVVIKCHPELIFRIMIILSLILNLNVLIHDLHLDSGSLSLILNLDELNLYFKVFEFECPNTCTCRFLVTNVVFYSRALSLGTCWNSGIFLNDVDPYLCYRIEELWLAETSSNQSDLSDMMIFY